MNLSDFLKVIDAGAASVYHQVLASGVALSAWEAQHPAIKPLISLGADYANRLLQRFGVDEGMFSVEAGDIVTGLKALAALDATVTSVPGTLKALSGAASVVKSSA